MRKSQLIGLAVAMICFAASVVSFFEMRARAQEAQEVVVALNSIPALPTGTVPSGSIAIGTVWTTSNGTSSLTIGTNATVTNANGYVLVNGGTPVIVSSRPPPRLLISCDENECHAHSQLGIDEARAMLERVTHRQVVIELVTDQHCQVQRETIQPKPKEDLVAAR